MTPHRCVDPAVELMTEHGILRRCLALYTACANMLEADTAGGLPWDVLYGTAYLVKVFIDDHHTRDEEAYVFPRVVGAPRGLIAELKRQHVEGRAMTRGFLQVAQAYPRGAAAHKRVAAQLRDGVRILSAHGAVEDTEVFTRIPTNARARVAAELEASEKLGVSPSFAEALHDVKALERAAGFSGVVPTMPKAPRRAR